MEHFIKILALVSQVNTAIEGLVNGGSGWAYGAIFLIIFSGAAFVFAAPILPSVSLIFLITSLSAAGILNPFLAYLILIAAIIIGDLSAYFLGSFTRNKVINNFKLPFIKEKHLEKTRMMYDKADFLATVFARFTPVVGSLAQFVAGAIDLKLHTFVKRNVVSGMVWMTVNFSIGWLCTAIPVLGRNFVMMFMVVPIVSTIAGIAYFSIKNLGALNFLSQRRNIMIKKHEEIQASFVE